MGSIVVDIGGTNLRCGVFADGCLQQVSRFKVNNFISDNNVDPEALYNAFLTQLTSALEPYLNDYPKYALALAFPGPIDGNGVVYNAATLWGKQLSNVPFQADCQKRLGRDIILMNDISAAVWRYTQSANDTFCLFTISSGVGNKIFRHGEILLSEHGHGGELGHLAVEQGDMALPCDCGGSGHLGAMASGRGLVQLAKYFARNKPTDFLSSHLALLSHKQSNTITSEHLVTAIKAGDAFSLDVLSHSQRYLVKVMSTLYLAMGLRRFIFIGGFVTALGETYITNLRQQLSTASWYCLSPDETSLLCELGELDDDHSLIGLGRYVERTHAQA